MVWTRRPKVPRKGWGVFLGVLVTAAAGLLTIPASADVATTSGLRTAAAAPSDRPEPHIIKNFAHELTGQRKIVSRVPRPPVRVRADIDGCDHNYGKASQCIPVTLPPGQRDYCTYLASHGFKQVTVRGIDLKQLDRNHNGIACD